MITKSTRNRLSVVASLGIAALVLVGCTAGPAEEPTEPDTPSVQDDSPPFVDFRIPEAGSGEGLKLGF
ncbi:hypothetical protein ACN4EK_32725, partial [Pantanalinema rosaneae CENA516]|uniref:hypothetical protein n=1 Tax=Pantanalinema rosaneae TaxID=1620701 RepID=UPI003D6F4A10